LTFLKDYRGAVIYLNNRQEIYNTSKDFVGGVPGKAIKGLHKRIFFKFEQDPIEFEKLTGLVFNQALANIWRPHLYVIMVSGNVEGPSFRVQNLRLVSRTGPFRQPDQLYVYSPWCRRAGVIV
jgi:hypothetical protein